MENRKGASPLGLAPNRQAGFSIFYFPFSTFLLALFLGGCASPGEPLERKPQVPAPVADLSAEQQGSSVVLSFTLPTQTSERRPLKQPPAVEIYRGLASAAPGLLVTIPPNLAAQYTAQQRFRWADSLRPEDFTGQPAGLVSYLVRTRVSAKRASADSNPVRIEIYPPAEPVADLSAEITPSGVALKWTPPQKSVSGSPIPVLRYEIYRAPVQTEVPTVAQAALASRPPLTQVGAADSPAYQDSLVELGKTYVYSVRSVSPPPAKPLSSDDSNFVSVTFKDIFPPAAPQGLVVVAVPAQGGTPAHLELSWAISPEADLAGYNIYRSDQEGSLGTRLNPAVLQAPAFRDMNVQPGRRYFYSVTALDRSGNESAPSAAASGAVPAEEPSAPEQTPGPSPGQSR